MLKLHVVLIDKDTCGNICKFLLSEERLSLHMIFTTVILIFQHNMSSLIITYRQYINVNPHIKRENLCVLYVNM